MLTGDEKKGRRLKTTSKSKRKNICRWWDGIIYGKQETDSVAAKLHWEAHCRPVTSVLMFTWLCRLNSVLTATWPDELLIIDTIEETWSLISLHTQSRCRCNSANMHQSMNNNNNNNNAATLVPSLESKPDGEYGAVVMKRFVEYNRQGSHVCSREGKSTTYCYIDAEAGLKNSVKKWAVENSNLAGCITKVSGEFPAWLGYDKVIPNKDRWIRAKPLYLQHLIILLD